MSNDICSCPFTREKENERATGIEPAWPAWKAGTLPLSYARAESKLPRHPANANSFFREPAKIPYPPEHLVFECGRHKGGVVAAETKRVIYHDTHFFFFCNIGRVIKVAFFARIFQIDSGWNHGIADGQRACGHFHATGPA